MVMCTVLLCSSLSQQPLVAAVPLLSRATTPAPPPAVAEDMRREIPEHVRRETALHEEQGGMESLQGDGGFDSHGYGHEDEDEYGYGQADGYGGAEMRASFDHDDLNDPEIGLSEEWENFMLFDKNSDAGVDLQEWLNRLIPPSDREASDSETRRWKGEFSEADLGKDGQLSWEDWKAMLFHEQPQEASWVDGHAPDALPPMTEDILLGCVYIYIYVYIYTYIYVWVYKYIF